MLESLAKQSRLPDQVIVIDEGESREDLASHFPQLTLSVLGFPEGSTSAKRNRGTQAAGSDITLIGFMDDDVVLEPGALEAMLSFWETAPADLGGASFNWVNHPPLFASQLKSLRITSCLGLYASERGAVLRSGFHTLIGYVPETKCVRWLPAGAAVYPRHVLEEHPFDEWFEGYGYLEDLDFSYRIGKKYRLAVVAAARFCHYPAEAGRPNPFLFGKKEVVNRLYFVRKHQELSSSLCCLALLFRSIISLFLAVSKLESTYLKRLAGNLAGLLLVLRGGLRPVGQ